MAHLIDRAAQLAGKGYIREFYATREQADFMANKMEQAGKRTELNQLWVHRGVGSIVAGGFTVYELWIKED
jgi:hypothetical protein